MGIKEERSPTDAVLGLKILYGRLQFAGFFSYRYGLKICLSIGICTLALVSAVAYSQVPDFRLGVQGEVNRYDANGHRVSRCLVDASGTVLWQEQDLYNTDGRLQTKIRHDGTVFEYHYAPDGQLLSEDWSAGQSPGGLIQYSYDSASGKLIETRQGDQVLHYAYYPDGTEWKMQYPDDRAQSQVFDQNDHLVSQQNTAGQSEYWVYNSSGQVHKVLYRSESIENYYSTPAERINHKAGLLMGYQMGRKNFSLNYDNYDRVSAFSLDTDSNQFATFYDYDPLNRLIQMHKHSGASEQPDLNSTTQYHYDSLGQVTRETFQPQGSSQLQVVTNQYEYDQNGNVVGGIEQGDPIDVAFNSLDQQQGLHYDKNGRLLQDAHGNRYVYSALDQLLRFYDHDHKVWVDYAYYPNGLLATRSVDQSIQTFYYATTPTQSVVADSQEKVGDFPIWPTRKKSQPSRPPKPQAVVNVMRVLNGNGTSTTVDYWVVGTQRIAAYTSDEPSDRSDWLISNKSVGASLVDGQLKGDDYWAYGQAHSVQTQPNLSPLSEALFGWDQEYRDPLSGLTYLRARDYSPELKHFISMDDADVDNKYGFGHADPVNSIDPSGHFATATAILIGLIATALVSGATAAIVKDPNAKKALLAISSIAGTVAIAAATMGAGAAAEASIIGPTEGTVELNSTYVLAKSVNFALNGLGNSVASIYSNVVFDCATGHAFDQEEWNEALYDGLLGLGGSILGAGVKAWFSGMPTDIPKAWDDFNETVKESSQVLLPAFTLFTSLQFAYPQTPGLTYPAFAADTFFDVLNGAKVFSLSG